VNTTTDEQRFTELYRQHYADISAYVRRRIDADQVTDIVAEVFATAWRRLDEIPRRAVLPWLYGVARRTLANAHRSNRRRLNLLEALGGEPAHHVGDHAEAVVQRHQIARAFEALSDQDQETLRLSSGKSSPLRTRQRHSGAARPPIRCAYTVPANGCVRDWPPHPQGRR
jgi:RNA polymerase sigma-70 factor (ECF subfamily)